jgi:V/A-type H+/Na+-transporting ATPase subunit F
MELAAVGRDEFVQGFKLAGIRRTVSVAREDLESQIAKVLEDPNVGILILSADDLASLSHPLRRRLDTTPRPVVIAIGRREEEDLREKIKRAIGVDLYK